MQPRIENPVMTAPGAMKALQQFTAVVPPQKVILGVPYYGYDWPTTTGASGAAATGGDWRRLARRRARRSVRG